MWCCRSGWFSSCCSWKRSCCCFRLLSIAARFCSCSRRCSSLASSFWSWRFPGDSTVLLAGVGLASFCRATDIHFRRPLGKELTSQSLRRSSQNKMFSEKVCSTFSFIQKQDSRDNAGAVNHTTSARCHCHRVRLIICTLHCILHLYCTCCFTCRLHV